ncbi:MAG: (2Fe-2S)-binding protein [Marinicaulis sp.]|nr:(2Fe-2S)-binding protein [Marinicaulis sp.]
MYICICNALREKEIEAAAGDDARTVTEVFRRCGARPRCGKCLTDVAQKIEDARMIEAGPLPLAAE